MMGLASVDGAPQQKRPTPRTSDAARGSTGGNVLLSNGSGDRTVSVTVDGFGTFGINTSAGDAIFDPMGPIGPAGTVFYSSVYFSPLGEFLDPARTSALSPATILGSTPTTVSSTFSAVGFDFNLAQELLLTPNGSLLTQTYEIFNDSEISQSFDLVRHVDGDLQFDGSITDFGRASADGRDLSEFDSGDDPSAASTFVGIRAEGGTPAGFTIQPFPYVDTIVLAGGIPFGVLNLVSQDADSDRITDAGYDVTLTLANTFTLAPGESAIYTTVTRFGDQTIVPRATLVFDPPDETSPLDEPPPQRLRAVPISAVAAAEGARTPQRQSNVTGYKVYASTTSPVATTPANVFTSLPPNQTMVNVPTSASGSFFVVTATYPTGESGPSNEASADVPAATLTSVKIKATKIVAKGSGFSDTVTVFVDGIPFVAQAGVKKQGKKVVQKGALLTGMTPSQYIASKGGRAIIQFRNSNGGIASFLVGE